MTFALYLGGAEEGVAIGHVGGRCNVAALANRQLASQPRTSSTAKRPDSSRNASFYEHRRRV
jgi:hypothetical protein